MNQIEFNSLKQSGGVKNAYQAKGASAKDQSTDLDSFQATTIPDLSAFEAAVESEFQSRLKTVASRADSDEYPNVEVVDRLAAFLAISLGAETAVKPE